jgi:ComF family protein
MLRRLFHDFTGVLFPRCCPICHKTLVEGEDLLCIECHWKIPRTYSHLDPNSKLLQKLISLRAPVERAAAYYFYHKGNAYSKLIQDAKYNGRPEINRSMARYFAQELKLDGFFDGIDCILPLPIHWWKQLRRGYNQSEYIALGLSDVTNIPIRYNLRAAKAHKTQTRKTGKERRKLVNNIFVVDGPDELAGKHVLLVDDVITTGTTILIAAEALHAAIPRLRLSLLSLASTELS